MWATTTNLKVISFIGGGWSHGRGWYCPENVEWVRKEENKQNPKESQDFKEKEVIVTVCDKYHNKEWFIMDEIP